MAGATTVRPDNGFRLLWWTAAAVLLVSGYAAAATGVLGQMPHVWLFSTVAFTWLTMAWTDETLLPRPGRRLVLTVGALGALAGGTAALMGASASDVVRSAVGVPLQAFLMALVYRAGRRDLAREPRPGPPGAGAWRTTWVRQWSPVSPVDLALLAVAALVSGAVGLLVGAAPGLHLGAVTDSVALEWMINVFVVTSVGGATTLITFGTWSRDEADQPWGGVLVVWLASVLVLWWVYATGAVNMAWLAVLPTVHVALRHSIWVTSTFGLLMGLVSLLLSPALNTVEEQAGPLPLGSVMDLLVSTLILVSLLLAQVNQRRMQLVTDLEEERAQARRQAGILQSVFESMHDGVVLIDPHFNVRMHNAAAVTILERSIPSRKPPSWTSYFRMTHLDGTPLLEQELISAEFLTVRVGDGTRVVRQIASRVSDDPRAGWMIFLTDITEHQARLQELSGFAGVVAHDLRAPLTSLEGWLEMAEESLSARDPQQASALLARARASNRRMRQVVTDWLAYTVERDGALQLASFGLTAPASEVAAQVLETIPHRFTLDAPHPVRADLGLVRQLFANLVGNAAKFTRPGEVPDITIRSRSHRGWVQVEVADRGIGLPPGEEERIFEEYHRAPGAAASREGYGMGLAACRRIVERHGGQISACTNAHGGATVTFTLPAADLATSS